ncbi:MAG: type II toxin-antitoxin system Phd/YefM family antitoxin [Acetobacteraceae bacterium]|nr:type II toxin-antitoxin system Phd/YefM family antitoxin [Acetobacteraceae bacterium]
MARARKLLDNGSPKARPISRYTGWKLQEAKAHFSEVVRRARSEGPQRVTVHGQDAVMVIAAEDFERLLPRAAEPVPFMAFMESLAVDGLDLTREPDRGRDVAL